MTAGDLAESIIKLIGRDIEILFDATRIRTQSPDIERLVADITKANDLLSWQPKTSLDDGLKQTIEWFSLSTDSGSRLNGLEPVLSEAEGSTRKLNPRDS